MCANMRISCACSQKKTKKKTIPFINYVLYKPTCTGAIPMRLINFTDKS